MPLDETSQRLLQARRVHQVADFLKSLETGTPCGPTFRDALETQKVCDAVLASARDRSWKEVG